MQAFRIREGYGGHREKYGRGNFQDFKAGDIVKSDRPLDKMFGKKFEPVADPDLEESGSEEENTGPSSKEQVTKGETPPTSDLGEDVTERFKVATDNGFVVYLKSGYYYVAEEVNPSIPLHDKGLRKERVAEFIENLTSEG